MRRKVLLALAVVVVACVGRQQVGATLVGDNKDETGSARPKFSETDTYLDLNTGKTFRFIYDGLNDVYNRDDLASLDLYVNTNTRDTFWMDEAIVVNNALLRDATGKYKIDPMKVKRDGNSFKVKDAFRK